MGCPEQVPISGNHKVAAVALMLVSTQANAGILDWFSSDKMDAANRTAFIVIAKRGCLQEAPGYDAFCSCYAWESAERATMTDIKTIEEAVKQTGVPKSAAASFKILQQKLPNYTERVLKPAAAVCLSKLKPRGPMNRALYSCAGMLLAGTAFAADAPLAPQPRIVDHNGSIMQVLVLGNDRVEIVYMKPKPELWGYAKPGTLGGTPYKDAGRHITT
jgi:hypothetical protein